MLPSPLESISQKIALILSVD